MVQTWFAKQKMQNATRFQLPQARRNKVSIACDLQAIVTQSKKKHVLGTLCCAKKAKLSRKAEKGFKKGVTT